MSKIIAGALILLSLLSCCSEKDSFNKKVINGRNYKLSFHDEFETDHLDASKWAFRTDNKHRSIQLMSNVEVIDGALVLNLKQLDEPIGGKLASGAGIVSKQRFKYGYYEVKAKLGDGIDDDNDGKVDEGWHHSFWAMAANIEDNTVSTTYPDIRRTEIDCYENPSEHRFDKSQNSLNKFTQHIIVWKEDGTEWGRIPSAHKDLTAIEGFNSLEWHTYSFEWTPETISFFVDGKLQHLAKYPVTEFEHDFVNVWLSAISANWNIKGAENSIAKYDYFRFYKLEEE